MASAPIQRERSRPTPPLLLAEALAAILASSLAIRLVPFKSLAARMTRDSKDHPAADPETAYWIRRAVLAWSKRVPWRALCFEQGLAAHMLLRRRRLGSTLHYGAATIDGELKAHVWVMSGETPVVGCENRDDYGLLARFPA